MNQLITTYKKREEEFDKKFVCKEELDNIDGEAHYLFNPDKDLPDIRIHNRQTQIEILEAEIADCEGRKKPAIANMLQDDVIFETYGIDGRICYNQALDDTIAIRKETIKYLKE